MFSLLNFLFDEDSLRRHVLPAWQLCYDTEYIESTIFPKIKRAQQASYSLLFALKRLAEASKKRQGIQEVPRSWRSAGGSSASKSPRVNSPPQGETSGGKAAWRKKSPKGRAVLYVDKGATGDCPSAAPEGSAGPRGAPRRRHTTPLAGSSQRILDKCKESMKQRKATCVLSLSRPNLVSSRFSGDEKPTAERSENKDGTPQKLECAAAADAAPAVSEVLLAAEAPPLEDKGVSFPDNKDAADIAMETGEASEAPKMSTEDDIESTPAANSSKEQQQQLQMQAVKGVSREASGRSNLKVTGDTQRSLFCSNLGRINMQLTSGHKIQSVCAKHTLCLWLCSLFSFSGRLCLFYVTSAHY